MSKAGDHVNLIRKARKELTFRCEGELYAEIDEQFMLNVAVSLNARTALAMAAWIIDMFGEKP